MPPKKPAWSKITANNNDNTSPSAPQGSKSTQKDKANKTSASPAVTNYSEIQQNEAEALRSIYMEDFEDVAAKPGAWNVRHHVESSQSHADQVCRNLPNCRSTCS